MKQHVLSRVVALLLAGATAIGFVACNGQITETETETKATTETVMTTESETVTETETVVVTVPETELETEPETEVDADTEVETDTEAESDADVDTETVTETVAATVPETEMDADTEAETEIDADTDVEIEFESDAEIESESDAETVVETVPETETETTWTPDVEMSDLNDLMLPIFSGNTVSGETVMFLDQGETKELLYPISSIISVTSYNGQTVYVEGVDYEIVEGKIRVLEGSAIPCITSNRYYTSGDGTVTLDGQKLYWGENQMQKWQVCVNYNHETDWAGFAQQSYVSTYESFLKKLEAGEDVTVIFYGDSITYGACSSWIANIQNIQYGKPVDPTFSTNQYPYSILFTQALADLFEYTVEFVDYTHLQTTVPQALTGAPKVPSENYVAGERGTITYINTSEGGESVSGAARKINKFLCEPIEEYGCDLLVVAYGMNDGGSGNINNKTEEIVDTVWEMVPDASVVIVSTMMPHPETNFDGLQSKQENNLQKNLIKRLVNREDKKVALACVNSITQSMLETKDFYDFAGNNVNHPNDFLHRIYAQTLLQTVIGYENLK